METLKFKSEKLVGRTKEVNQLQGVLNELKEGRGKTVFVSGESGVGKTRLMNETITYMEDQGVRTVSVYCLPHENTDSYLPFTEILKHIAPDQPLIPTREEKFVSLDEVFLVYKSGLLIAHTSKKEQELDSDVVAGMFTAVQDFVKDTFGRDKKMSGSLRKLEYGDKNILIEHGKNIYVAAVLIGPTETKGVYGDIRGMVELIEKDYPVLEKWDGNFDKIKGTETVLKMLTSKNYPIEKTIDKNLLDAERLRVFEHVLNIVIDVAKENPLLLFFDDLQWADPSSLQLLHYLSRNTREYPVLLCGAYRPEELVPTPQGKPHPLKETMQLMSREELVTNISLDRLKQDDTTDLVKGIFAHTFNPEFTQRLHQETEGNPFFTEELLRAMVLDGIIYHHNAVWEAKDISKVVIPSSVKDTVMRRINVLDKDCQEVLKYASVIGQIFQFQTLAKATGRDRKELADMLEKIEKQGIIHSKEDVLKFDHAKLQEVIYADIPKYKKTIMHEETAKALEELNQEKTSTVAEELAHHYHQAGISEKTVEYALLAAENAEKKFTPAEAVEHYMTAMQALEKMKSTPENKDKQLKTADKIAYMDFLLGNWDDALKYAEKSIELANTLMNRNQVYESYKNIAEIHIARGDYSKAEELLKKTIRLCNSTNNLEATGECYSLLGKMYWHVGKLNNATQVLEKALSLGKQIRSLRLEAKAMIDCAAIYDLKGSGEKALPLMMQCLQIFEKLQDKYEVVRSYNYIGTIYGDCYKNYKKGLEYYEQQIKLCQETNDLRNLGDGYLDAGWYYTILGKLEKASDYTKKAFGISKKLGEKRMISLYHRNYGMILAKSKDFSSAKTHFEISIEIAKELEDLWVLSHIYYWYAQLYRKMTDMSNAKRYLKLACEVYENLGNKSKVEEIRKEMEKLGTASA